MLTPLSAALLCAWPASAFAGRAGQELTLDFELKTAGRQEAVTVIGTGAVANLEWFAVSATVTIT